MKRGVKLAVNPSIPEGQKQKAFKKNNNTYPKY